MMLPTSPDFWSVYTTASTGYLTEINYAAILIKLVIDDNWYQPRVVYFVMQRSSEGFDTLDFFPLFGRLVKFIISSIKYWKWTFHAPCADEGNSPNDGVFPGLSIPSRLEKGLQLLQQMSQHATAKYDYCSSEVTALPSLVLNIKN